MSIDSRTIQAHTLRRLHTLFGKVGITDKEGKSEVIYSATDGRTCSSKELLEYEALILCANLQQLQNNKPKPAPRTAAPNEAANKLRRRIISNYHTMNYQTMRNGKMVADMPRINAKLKEKWGKEINAYTIDELKKIIGVLERSIVPHYQKNSQ